MLRQRSSHQATVTPQIYLIPGLFGFSRLAGHDYFVHLERELKRAHGAAPVRVEVVRSPPTASILVRAGVLAEAVTRLSQGTEGPIHLVGHSTGGLDARLLLSPCTDLRLPESHLRFRSRVESLVTVNCPHHGTPLAGYFTTVAGTRLLYALSLLTIASLSIGKLPLTALTGIMAGVSTLDDKLGIEVKLLDSLTEFVLRYVGDQARNDVSAYLNAVQRDRGGIVQLMPEVMSVFNASVTDHPEVRYGCTVSAAPRPGPRHLLPTVLSPLATLSRAIYAVVYEVTAANDRAYPYATPSELESAVMTRELGRTPGGHTVDGIVPTLSMLRGELLYSGQADHLDVVGHFADSDKHGEHVDWLSSGARFGRADFATLCRAIATFQQRTPLAT